MAMKYILLKKNYWIKKNHVCKQKRILPALLAMKIFFQSQKQQKVENISNELMSSQWYKLITYNFNGSINKQQ